MDDPVEESIDQQIASIQEKINEQCQGLKDRYGIPDINLIVALRALYISVDIVALKKVLFKSGIISEKEWELEWYRTSLEEVTKHCENYAKAQREKLTEGVPRMAIPKKNIIH